MKADSSDGLKAYLPKTFSSDISSGIVVASSAIPLALAFAVAIGVSPVFGLGTAIVSGLVISAFGGSRAQIGGPSLVLAAVAHGLILRQGYPSLAFTVLLAGFLLVFLGFFRKARLVRFIPHAVIAGCTAGIALSVVARLIGCLLGLPSGVANGGLATMLSALASSLQNFNPWSVSVAAVSLAAIIALRRLSPVIPGSLIVLFAASIATAFFGILVDTVSSLYGSVSFSRFALPVPAAGLGILPDVASSALAIAVFASVESLFAADVAQGMTGRHHDADRDLVAAGLANIAGSFFGCLPSCISISLTAIGVSSGSRTRVAGLAHAAAIVPVMVFFGLFSPFIPLPVLVAVLASAIPDLGGIPLAFSLLKGRKSDVVVFFVSFIAASFASPVAALITGFLVASIFFFLASKSPSPIARIKAMEGELKSADLASRDDPSPLSLRVIPKGVMVFGIVSPPYPGTVPIFAHWALRSRSRGGVLVLRMKNTLHIDEDGLRMMGDLLEYCGKKGVVLLVSEIHTQPFMLAASVGLDETLGAEHIFGNLDEALEYAKTLQELPVAASP